MAEKLALGAQAVNILNAKLVGVCQAFKRFFKTFKQLVAGALGFGTALTGELA